MPRLTDHTPPINSSFTDDFLSPAFLCNVAHLKLSGRKAWTIMAALQLAAQNPNFPKDSRKTVEDVARQIQREICITPALNAVAEKGWNRKTNEEASNG